MNDRIIDEFQRFGRKRSWSDRSTIQAFPGGPEANNEKVSITGAPAESGTKHPTEYKARASVCLISKAPCHEGVRGSGRYSSTYLDLGTSWR
jgi:hypothetical protein